VDTTADLLKTPLHSLHLELGARMAGVCRLRHADPVQDGRHAGAPAHPRQCRAFRRLAHGADPDPRQSGDVRDAALALETITPVDVADLKPGRQRYGLFTNDKGGLEDDFMVANRGDHLYLVVNAACKHDDLARIKAALSGTARSRRSSTAD
jgi:aminomethyltransferase